LKRLKDVTLLYNIDINTTPTTATPTTLGHFLILMMISNRSSPSI